MADAVGAGGREGVDGVADGEAAALDQVAHDEVAGAVEAVVAVDADKILLAPAGLRRRPRPLVHADLVHELDEGGHLRVRRRDLGHRGELVVLDPLSEALRVVHRVVVADVDYILDDMSPCGSS